MYIVQSVLNHLKNINPLVKNYVLALLLSHGPKNCAAMARSTKLSQKRLYAFLSKGKTFVKEIEECLISLAKETRKQDALRALTIDPTTIIKRYAEKMEKVSYDRSGCTKHVERCLVPVYAAVTDDNVTIPLNLEFWVQKKITGKRKYKSKVQISQELISRAIDKGIDFDFVPLDGAYATPDMFNFFQRSNLNFIMRIPRNRRITLEDGTRVQLQRCLPLKLKRNERTKTISAELYGKSYFFTAHKRKKRYGGWETVFLASSMNLPAKEQVAAYDLRWPMEKMNRTTKQKFGATQCQALESSKQYAHLMAGFLTYAILSSTKNDKKKQSVDVLVNFLREFHFNDLIDAIKINSQSRRPLNIDPIANYLQNQFQNSSQYHDSVGCSMR
jgi:hypothetical protein